MNKLNLQAPWTTYANEVEKLFEKDPEVAVEYDDAAKKLMLYVDSQEKAEALDSLFPNEVEFGNVKVTVEVIPANITDLTMVNLFERAFKGNPAVSYIKTVEAMGFSASYVVFQPEVVQFFNDNLGDINGNETTLYEKIADDVFDGRHEGVFFCTDEVK